MSIKPCPACDSDYDGDWSHGTAGPQLVCGNPGCKLCGPCGDDLEDAEKRWDAMPRRAKDLREEVNQATNSVASIGYLRAAVVMQYAWEYRDETDLLSHVHGTFIRHSKTEKEKAK